MQSSKIWNSFILCMLILTTSCTPCPQLNGTVFDTPVEAHDIAGTNHDGMAFRLSDTRHKITIVFFGYTFCPDVCPITLADLNTVNKSLGDRATEVAVVSVTVDPDCDMLEKMGQYVNAFNSTFYGARMEGEAQYFVDHTAAIYLIDHDGDLHETFPYDASPEQIFQMLSIG